ncbi:N-acetylmuramic acid 6-phosphate etherase [Nonlabens tegetincola]|uniref:N-acetylmuramic acid 6-phosphate etherase n=1 Tax=Nonlabens tegetincola TaxID=323273 RepID=UPI000A2032F3|nr:N-acetylmuramic acid 6-phosphate etherase [Nonlabens tegetincola]ARN70883.1 N-acetylmuramic acid 6-phosphate etherase [Nonlabens tegetincola]
MQFKKTTEESSLYQNLETMSTATLLENINAEDHKVALAVKKVLPAVEKLVDRIVLQMNSGGRLFYIGAGTSGRLGILDASECPPTFGVSYDKVIGLIAGGDVAIRKAVENAEDNNQQAIKDLKKYNINAQDVVIGIAASGTTPYVIGGLQACKQLGIHTGAITCNLNSPLDQIADDSIVPIVGPEFVTGSSRMKAGTAQKMVLNMISTSVMIKLGHVKGNKMVDMQLSNDKLVDRGTRMIMENTGLGYEKAHNLLLEHGSVRAALDNYGVC